MLGFRLLFASSAQPILKKMIKINNYHEQNYSGFFPEIFFYSKNCKGEQRGLSVLSFFFFFGKVNGKSRACMNGRIQG